ncbi:MAG: zinc-binding dehydrogenase [Bacteroidia bacterium]|nr:zinc-binding dehydrogenase [Bacteroidia bacterium]
MKAFTKTKYGGPEVLRLEEVARPTLKEGHILVKIKANSANPADWHIIRGKPLFARLAFGLFKPKDKIPGADFAGIVEEVGKNVTRFKVGADQVIAYDKEDIHQHEGKYNLIIDTHGNLSHEDYKRMGQRGVMVGFTTIGTMISVLINRVFSKFPLAQFTAEASTKDLETLATLIQDRKIKVHIERTYSYNEIPEAIRYIEAMHTKGKVAMVW